MHQNFPVQQKEAMTAGNCVFSRCLTEMYHITPLYETSSPSHTCTEVLTITHIVTLTSPLVWTEQWSCTQCEFYRCWQWLLASLCASFYDHLYLEYIPNALWIDVVLWALAFTLHLKCGCLWNGLEWNGKKEPVSYFHLSPSLSLASVSFASLTLSQEINDEMSNIRIGVFPLPSVTVQDSVNNDHWNGQIMPNYAKLYD